MQCVDEPRLNCFECLKLKESDGVPPGCESGGPPCSFKEHRDALDPKADHALEVYSRINTRFVKDFNALPMLFEILNIKLDSNDALELFDMLSSIHKEIMKKEDHDYEAARQRLLKGKK